MFLKLKSKKSSRIAIALSFLALVVIGLFYIINVKVKESSSLKTYSDWQSGRFYLKYPDGWWIHSEVIQTDPSQKFESIVKELPFESYFEKFFTINGKKAYVRDVVNAGMAYGRVIEARVPYTTDSYIWITARKEHRDGESEQYSKTEIQEFIDILETLTFKD